MGPSSTGHFRLRAAFRDETVGFRLGLDRHLVERLAVEGVEPSNASWRHGTPPTVQYSSGEGEDLAFAFDDDAQRD